MKVMALLALVAAAAAGCARESVYVNPDEPDVVGGTGIDSQDVRTVAQVMSHDLVSALARPGETRPIIALLPTRNETRFRIDTDIITQQMRDQLMQFAGDRARFVVRSRIEDVRAERAAQEAGEVSGTVDQKILGADYFLTGILKSISKTDEGKVSDYIYYSFELIDARTTEAIWAKGYDVKKVGERGVLYR
jgi:hypothetical protein